MTQPKRLLKRSSGDESGHVGAFSLVNASMKQKRIH